MGREAIIKALKAHSRPPITQNAVDAFIDSMAGESDRGLIIIAASLVEDALVQTIEDRLAPLNRKERDALFDFNGPMGTFSSRIKVAQALSIISRETRKHIEMIREMRNACAHSPNRLTFADEAIRQAVFSMFVHQIEPTRKNEPGYARVMFNLMVVLLTSIIIAGDAAKGAAIVNDAIQQENDERERPASG